MNPPSVARVLLGEDWTFPAPAEEPFSLGQWPGRWVACPGAPAGGVSFVVAYRLRFTLPSPAVVRAHVSADQRYDLFLDGVRLGRGPERGDPLHWFFETYDLQLGAGDHVLVARVSWQALHSGFAPAAQNTVRPGFLLVAEPPHEAALSTGRAPWEARLLNGYAFVRSPFFGAGQFAGGSVRIEGGDFPWRYERGEGDEWRPVLLREAATERLNRYGEMDTRRLRPALLPPMMDAPRPAGTVRQIDAAAGDSPVDPAAHRADEVSGWQALLAGAQEYTVPARTRRRVLIDLGDYCCAYPEVTISGGRGGRVRLHWAESLYEGDEHDSRKGDRNEIAGKRFIGRGDTFLPDGGGGRRFDTLWWSCGRYLELLVETADEPLTLDALLLRETRYPLQREGALSLDDARFDAIQSLLWRTLQMCAHETYMDCPYYEQLMYAGDARLEALVTFVSTRDDRLPRKAIRLFGASQSFSGLTQARTPSHLPQLIPQFSLFWVAMVHDYALWRGDRTFVAEQMPRVRAVLEVFLAAMDRDGLLVLPEGWSTVDWVPAWRAGQPPADAAGRSAINQWQLVYVLGLAAELERWVGEPGLAERLEDRRRQFAKRADAAFWDPARGLYADTPDRDSYSEHAQCYALLSGLLTDERRARLGAALLSAPDLHRATIYFRHYLFEALCLLERTDVLLERMDLWYALPGLGLKTALESPEPSRSDCHAWSAHPLYHGVASILGLRPAALGFEKIRVCPQLGPLSRASGTLPSVRGDISLDVAVDAGGTYRARVTLPAGLTGEFLRNGRSWPLREGTQEITAA